MKREAPGNKHDHAGALEHLKFENSARCFASPPRRAWSERTRESPQRPQPISSNHSLYHSKLYHHSLSPLVCTCEQKGEAAHQSK